MRIPIKTNQSKYFKQVLELMSAIPPISTLSNREKELLAIMLLINWRAHNLGDDERAYMVTGKYMREKAINELNIKPHTVRTLLSNLKKKGFFDSKGLAKWLNNIEYGKDIVFNFKEV